MTFSEEHNLTEAGEAFLISYLVSAAPELAARAVQHLKDMEADYRGPAPGYWINMTAK
jgi:hypothetical protein